MLEEYELYFEMENDNDELFFNYLALFVLFLKFH